MEDEEKPPASNIENTTEEISKDEQLLTDSKADLKTLDILVCGQCHETCYFLEEFQEHKANDGKCTKISKLETQCENESFSQVWAFTLWKNKQIRDKSTKNDGKTTSSWEIYQEWCNLEPSLKLPWITAGKAIQCQSKINFAKVQKVEIKHEEDPLALDGITKSVDTNKAVRTIRDAAVAEKKNDKQEFVVEKIVAKRFNPRRRTFEYQIKWENFESEQNTWEPVANLSSCKKMVEEFDENLRQLKAAEKLKQTQSKGRGRGRGGGANSAMKSFLSDLTPGRPVRTSKQKALDQVKQWCGNISEEGESGSKRPYNNQNTDEDSDDSFEKKMKFDDYSDDSDIEFKCDNVKKVFTKPTMQQLNNGNALAVGKNKIPQNVLIPDANGVVRINQKQLPSLSSGVYIMSKTAGIIRLDSSTSKVATQGGQTIVKVAPKIGQTQIKIVRKEPQQQQPVKQIMQQKIVKSPSAVTFVKKISEDKKQNMKPDDESDDGLEEMEFPTDLPLPEPESPTPSEFVLDPTTGKLAGQEYEEKNDVEMETANVSLENIVKLAAADITEDDLKSDSIVEENNRTAVAATTTPTVVVVQPTTTKTPIKNTVVTNSMNILNRSLTAPPKPKSTPRILNQSRGGVMLAQSNNSTATTIHTSPRALNQASPVVRSTKVVYKTQPPTIQRVITTPRPRFNITTTTTTTNQQQQHATRVYTRQPSSTTTTTTTVRRIGETDRQLIRPHARIIQTNVYKASPRKDHPVTVQQQVVQKKKAVINMPSLDEQPTTALKTVEQQEVTVEKKEEVLGEKSNENAAPTANDFQFTLTDQENPIYITGDDGTVYQVAGQNEQGQTILITQDSNGQQQCLLVTNESVQDESNENNCGKVADENNEITTTDQQQEQNDGKGKEEMEMEATTVNDVQEEKSAEDPLKGEQNSNSDQVIAQLVRAEPPSPGGTRKVVIMLPNGSLMVTQVTEEEYASLDLE